MTAEVWGKGSSIVAARRASDPEFSSFMVNALREGIAAREERRATDPEFAEKLRDAAREAGAKGVANREARRKVDPEYAQKLYDALMGNIVERTAARDARNKVRRETDPEYDARVRAGLRKASEASRQRFAADPELVVRVKEASSRAASTTNRRRLKCNNCGVIRNPGNMGSHMKASNHSGSTLIKNGDK